MMDRNKNIRLVGDAIGDDSSVIALRPIISKCKRFGQDGKTTYARRNDIIAREVLMKVAPIQSISNASRLQVTGAVFADLLGSCHPAKTKTVAFAIATQ